MQGREYFIKNSPVIIGRKREADISLPYDVSLSRFHCQLLEIDGQYFIEDMGSGNGTWVNQKVIYERTQLTPPCVFRVGQTHLCLMQDHAQPTLSLPKLSQDVLNERAATVIKSGAVLPPLPEPTTAGQLQLVNDALDQSQIQVAEAVDPRQLTLGNMQGGVSASEIHRLRRRLQVIGELAETLVGKVNTHDLLDAMLAKIMSVVPAERGFAVLVEKEWGKLSPVIIKHAPQSSERTGVRISRTILEKSLRERMALLIYDAQNDHQLQLSESFHGSSIRSLMCVPLMYQDKTSAIVVLDTRKVNAFTQEDLELATVIASQAAVALENTRLYEELQRAYNDLRTTQEQLAQAEKLSIIGTLSASVAHDINNVLTPILGIADLVLTRPDIDRPLKEMFERQMHRLKTMAKELLSFSRPAPSESVSVDINQCITQSVNLLQTEARHNKVQIQTRLADRLPPINVNPNRLDQVFINLSLNAIQAMSGQGGSLVISTRQEENSLLVTFSDSGPGIRTEHLALLGQPFFTTKGNKGTGLGLFSCKQIVEKEHGGKLEVFSGTGKGATFVIRLPLAQLQKKE